MPYVNIKITREGGTTPEQKADLIKGVTDVLVAVLDKSQSSTFVVIDEVDLKNWGIGGLPVNEYRRSEQQRSLKRGLEYRQIAAHDSNSGLGPSAREGGQE